MTTIAIQTGDAPALETELARRIHEFNAESTGYHDGEAFSAEQRCELGRLRGGISGYTWGGSAYISYLWVARELRGQGIGGALLTAAERHARAKGCRLIFLATHTFQAPRFYGQHGYLPIARIPDHPVGHATIHLAKTLGPE